MAVGSIVGSNAHFAAAAQIRSVMNADPTDRQPTSGAPLLTPIGRDIWIVDGPAVRFFGFQYPTRMTIVRLRDGALWLCSPIALGESLAQAVATVGVPRYLIAPNKLHHLFLGDWQRRWPEARLYAAPGLRRRRPDLRFEAELGNTPEPDWADDIDQVIFGGSFIMKWSSFIDRRAPRSSPT
jgi:hypothetical protein